MRRIVDLGRSTWGRSTWGQSTWGQSTWGQSTWGRSTSAGRPGAGGLTGRRPGTRPPSNLGPDDDPNGSGQVAVVARRRGRPRRGSRDRGGPGERPRSRPGGPPIAGPVAPGDLRVGGAVRADD